METARYISSSIAARAQLADEVESPLSSTPVFVTDLLILSTIVIHGSRSLSLSLSFIEIVHISSRNSKGTATFGCRDEM